MDCQKCFNALQILVVVKLRLRMKKDWIDMVYICRHLVASVPHQFFSPASPSFLQQSLPDMRLTTPRLSKKLTLCQYSSAQGPSTVISVKTSINYGDIIGGKISTNILGDSGLSQSHMNVIL